MQHIRQLGSERLAVLLAIALHMHETGSCYPTQEQIADMLGISRTTAKKRIKQRQSKTLISFHN